MPATKEAFSKASQISKIMCRHIFFWAAAWLRMVWHHKFLYHWIAHLLRNTVVIFFSKQGKYLPTYRKLYGKQLQNYINCCPAAGLCMKLFPFHGGKEIHSLWVCPENLRSVAQYFLMPAIKEVFLKHHKSVKQCVAKLSFEQQHNS